MNELLSFLRERVVHDYGRDGPSLFDPRQPRSSLLRTMLMWMALWLCLDVLVRSALLQQAPSDPYAHPWLLLLWSLPGAAAWWADKIRYQQWLARRCESSLRVIHCPHQTTEANA
jgi:hypothetical protein